MKKQNRLFLAFIITLLTMTGIAGLALATGDTGTTIAFEGQTITAEGSSVSIAGTTATITEPGTYTLSGTLEGGEIIINCSGKLTLILENANITSNTGPAIDVQAAGQVILTLASGTQNTVTDAATYTNNAGGQDAAIFSRADMVITGDGTLSVNALHNDGIASRDTLLIEGGTISVNATNHGIKGKDYLMITGGTVTINAGGDAIKATNDTQSDMGYASISGGTLSLTAKDDGISAVTTITIATAEITINSENIGMKSSGDINILSGNITINYGDDDFICQTKEIAPEASVTLNKI